MSKADQQAKWVQIQRKTFTKWCNSHLRRRFAQAVEPIEAIENDLEDGIRLYKLINALYDQPMPKKYNKTPKMRPHRLDNCVMAVKMIEDAGVKLNFFRPDHLVDHDMKMILGMVWAVILDYQIKGISVEELSAKEGLLLWCQKKTEGYKNVKVDNFHMSFQDGLAFCALIHRHRPDLLDFDSLSKDNPRENLELAFSVAEEKLNIPRLLDAEDLVDVPRPDERSVMTYVSEYFHCFASQNQQEVAGRRIAKVVKLTQANDAMKAEYIDKATALAEWVRTKTAALNERAFDNTLDGVKSKMGEFQSYKKTEKPEKTLEKLACEQTFNNLTMKLRASNRPEFSPPDGTSLSELNTAWAALEQAEKERGAALSAELLRQEKLEQLANRFFNKSKVFQQWAEGKKALLDHQEGESFSSVGQVAARTQMLDAFDAEVAAGQARLDTIKSIGGDLTGDNFRESDKVSAKVAELDALYGSIGSQSSDRRGVLGREKENQEKQEELRKEFARQAKEFDRWLKDEAGDARDFTTFGDSLEDVTAYEATLSGNEQRIASESEQKAAAVGEVDAALKALGVTYNMYTNLTVEDLQSRRDTLSKLLEERRAAYGKELERQQAMEAKRKEFAEAASGFVEYLAGKKGEINAVEGEPQEKIAAVKSIHDEADGDARLAAVNKLDGEMREMGIVYNQHTKLSYPALEARWNSHKTFVANFLDNLEQDVQLQQRAADNAKEWEKQEQQENMRIEFAKRSAALNQWLQGANEELSEPVRAKSVEQVKEQQATLDGFKGELPAKAADRDSLNEYSKELVAAGITENPLAELTIDEINTRFGEVEAGVAERDAALAAEAERQAANDALRKEFADKAEAVNGTMDSTLEQLKTADGEPEDQLKALDGLQLDRAGVDEVCAVGERLAAAGVHDNQYTTHTAESITAKYNGLEQSVSEKRKALNAAISARTHGEVPEEQLQEIQECFEKFDKDQKGGLAKHEFKACLSALGEDVSDTALEQLWSQRANADSLIDANQFTDFMIGRLQDQDSEQQIVDSFKMIAGDRDFVTENDLRLVFRDEAELKYMLENMPKKEGVEGGYDYVAYTKDMFSR
eukprot:TRINITY_DN6252_c0_g1_i2.p1 TRINITY_DN6252_c0_g1~~TRINITY_DN6252_c0_g1_i2.p1  ORF type:complete len:1140 (-),score=632.07 TRINITY_DN6252_c0_g1_i2:233-3508(-)